MNVDIRMHEKVRYGSIVGYPLIDLFISQSVGGGYVYMSRHLNLSRSVSVFRALHYHN